MQVGCAAADGLKGCNFFLPSNGCEIMIHYVQEQLLAPFKAKTLPSFRRVTLHSHVERIDESVHDDLKMTPLHCYISNQLKQLRFDWYN